MQTELDRAVRALRAERFQRSPQITLGELIERLEALPLTYLGSDGEERPKPIVFDFCGAQPHHLTSWRGAYAELAIVPTFESVKPPSAVMVLAMLRDALGHTFEGYKGGEFTMDAQTPVWVARWGESGNTGVIGVRDAVYDIVIDTAWCDY